MMQNFRLLLLLSLLIVACRPSSDDDPAAAPTLAPTDTLLPMILTETPRVTATLTPSATFTPSDTPIPSETPTPVTPTATNTLTPTPPRLGQVISSQNVNVREGPAFDQAVITSVEPGQELETHYASEDELWVFVRFIAEDGNLIEGWINEPLLDMGTWVPPTLGPTPAPTLPGSEPNGTDTANSAFITPTPAEGLPSAEDAAEASDINILAYCIQVDVPAPRVRSSDTVSIEWSWFVARPDLMDEHLAHAQYEVLINGRLLENYEEFQTQMRREADNNWYVYWYVPVGQLEPGRYEVTYLLEWDEPVNDGFEAFGPGTPNETNEGNCIFTVVE